MIGLHYYFYVILEVEIKNQKSKYQINVKF